MAPKPSKEDAPDMETTRSEFITKLSTAADAMRNFSTLADALAKVVAKVPLDDPELVETLHAVADAVPAPSRKRKLAVTDVADESGKKRKREKKPKDPNAPKAPPSAYIMFQNDIRNAVREQHPDLQYKELMGLISKQWSALPIDKKQPYFDKVINAKKTHEIDLAKYNAQHPDHVADEGSSKKVKKPAAELAEKPAKKAAPTKVAKVAPKSAPTVPSSSDESDAGSGSEASSDGKSGAKSEEDESSEEESSEEDQRPSKKTKKSEKRK